MWPFKEKKISFSEIIKKYFKLLAVLLVVLIVLISSFSTRQQVGILARKIDDLTKTSEQLVSENNELKQFAFEICTGSNFWSDYFMTEKQDCSKFFPDIAEEAEAFVNVESEFIDVADIFFIAKDKNQDLAKAVIAVWDFEGKNMAIDPEKAEDRKKQMQNLLSDENITSYLTDYGLTLEQESDKMLHLKQNGETVADIYWNDEDSDVKMNVFSVQKIFSLSTFSAVEKKAQHNINQNSGFSLQEMITKANELRQNMTPVETYFVLGRHGSNVDTIMLAVVNHQKQQITLISIPRDLWVNSRKVNSLHAVYGMSVFEESVEKITGLEIKNYVLIDMLAFVEVVDKLNGVDYYFSEPLIDPSYRTVDDGKEGTLYFSQGEHHLNGTQALRVARTRHTTNDFARADRQQRILKSIKNKITEEGKIKSYIEMLPVLMDKMETDMTTQEAVMLIMKVKDYDVRVGNVMSTGNILTSEMLDLGPASAGTTTEATTGEGVEGESAEPVSVKAYTLKPKDDNWNLIKDFIITAVYGDY